MEEPSSDHGATPAGAVFLSYASEDAAAAARICDGLRSAGIEVWLDQSELRGGDAWDHKIRRQIRECALFVPIVSEHSVRRAEGYFRLEWKLAIDRSHLMASERAFLIPVVIDATPESGFLVPDRFREVQWTRLAQGQTSPAFVDRVNQLLSQPLPATNWEGRVPATRAAGPASAVTARASTAGRVVIRFACIALVVVTGALLGRIWFRHNGLVPEVLAPQAARPPESLSPPARSVAVLPFADMSEKHDQDYFADGLTEELIDHLSHNAGLRVIARTSSFYFKGKQTTIKDVASTLNVSNVLEGSVRKSGNVLRISTQLDRGADGVEVWSQTYDRSLSDIFKVQTEIATQVATALDAVLEGGADPARGTRSVEAYNLLLEGKYYESRGNAGDLARATDAYRRALKIDVNYAYAWVRLGRTYLFQDFRKVDRASAERAATAAADHALAVDPKFAPAHHLIANIVEYQEWSWNNAAAAYQRAWAFADGQERLSIQLDYLYLQAARAGHYDSSYRRLLEERLVDNPLDTSLMISLAYDYLYSEDSAKCVELLQHARAINPIADGINSSLAYALMMMGRFNEAWAAAQAEANMEDKRQISAMLTWSLGRRAESDRLVAAAERPPTDAYSNAQIHAWRGEKDQAFQWLQTAFQEHSNSLIALRLDPVLKRLQADFRYEALLRRMNLSAVGALWPTDRSTQSVALQ
ncbi:MAG: TIR domain-containing protein [Steroidobacteraceae bacterium]